MIVTSETRTAYYSPGAGRAFLTSGAAYHAEARSRLAKHCECCPGDTIDIGMGLVDIPGTESCCRWHDPALEAHQLAVVKRWARLLRSADRARP